jgi:Tol biopolymer transport system component
MMKNLFSLCFASSLGLVVSCTYDPCDPVAEIVAPEVISTSLPEFATTLSKDGSTLYFNRTSADRSQMKIWVSHKEGNSWKEPSELPFSTGEYRDVDPFITADGNRLYFSSDRPVETTDSIRDFDTWYVERVPDGWSDPVRVTEPLNSDQTEIFLTLTDKGTAYVVSERNGRRGIVRSVFNGEYQEPEPVELRYNGETVYASNPCISSDERFLIVAMRHTPDIGPDLYISFRKGKEWTPLQSLGPAVNSPFADFAAGLSKDDKVLYFSSERPGMVPETTDGSRPPGDLYRIQIDFLVRQLKVQLQ